MALIECISVRPQWRVSAEEEKTSQPAAPAPIATNRHSRSSRASTEEKASTTIEFRVDSNSRHVPVTAIATPYYLQSGTMSRGYCLVTFLTIIIFFQFQKIKFSESSI